MGATPVDEGHDNGHHDRRAADEDTGDGGLGRTFRRDDGHVEADHADGREQREAGPLPGRECPQPGRRAAPHQRHEQQAGEAVAQELAARVRVVAQDAVGGEGRADEDAGECGEERSAGGGGVHGNDARERGGPH